MSLFPCLRVGRNAWRSLRKTHWMTLKWTVSGTAVADRLTHTVIEQLYLHLAFASSPWPNELVQSGLISGRASPSLATGPSSWAHLHRMPLVWTVALLGNAVVSLFPECRLRTRDPGLCHFCGKKCPLAKMTAELPPMPRPLLPVVNSHWFSHQLRGKR